MSKGARDPVYYIGRPLTLSVDVESDTLPIVGRHMDRYLSRYGIDTRPLCRWTRPVRRKIRCRPLHETVPQEKANMTKLTSERSHLKISLTELEREIKLHREVMLSRIHFNAQSMLKSIVGK